MGKTTYLNNKFLYYLSILSATCPVQNIKFKRLYRCLQMTQTAIYVYLLITKSYITENLTMENEYFQKSPIILYILHISYHFLGFTTVSAIICSQFFGQTNINAWEQIGVLDDTIKNVKIWVEFLKTNRLVELKTDILMLFYAFYLTVLAIPNSNWKSPLQQTLCLIINFSVKVQYYSWMNVISTRFKFLNRALTKPNCDLELILDRRRCLITLTKTINKSYSFMLLIYIGLSTVILISNCYLLVFEYLISGGINNYISVILILTLLTALLELVFLASCSATVCLKANSTTQVLHGLLFVARDSSTIKQEIHHLMHNKLNIMTCRLFNVDFTMLFSIIATSTNYLIIMVQFDLDSLRRNRYLNQTNHGFL